MGSLSEDRFTTENTEITEKKTEESRRVLEAARGARAAV
jgi:hypothetical protein